MNPPTPPPSSPPPVNGNPNPNELVDPHWREVEKKFPGLLAKLPRAALKELMPRPTEVLLTHRAFRWGLIGCCTIGVGLLLALLLVPMWKVREDAKTAVREHLELLRDGKLAEAYARCTSEMLQPVFLHHAKAFAAALAGGTFEVQDFQLDSGEAYVTGKILTLSGAVRFFRYQVFLDDDGEIRIFDFEFTSPGTN